MLPSTLQLVELLKSEKEKRNYEVLHSHLRAVLQLGTRKDAELLLKSYLQHPLDYDHQNLFPVFRKFGDTSFAIQLFDAVIKDNRLVNEFASGALKLLGDLKYEPIKPVLFHYGFSEPGYDYHLETSALLGLLNFDCAEYQSEIQRGIQNCMNKNLFPEFMPALVCKLSDKTELLEQLYELGEKHASTDCNAGIVLGFSLCGQEGEGWFRKVLFNPNWETWSSATGTAWYTYQGLKNLNIRLADLYLQLKEINDVAQLDDSLDVFLEMLDNRIRDWEGHPIENIQDLFAALFSWESPNHSNNLVDLAQKVQKENEVYRMKRLLEAQLNDEILLVNWNR